MKLLMRRIYAFMLKHNTHTICKQLGPNIYRVWFYTYRWSHHPVYPYGLEISPEGVKELFNNSIGMEYDDNSVPIIHQKDWVVVNET